MCGSCAEDCVVVLGKARAAIGDKRDLKALGSSELQTELRLTLEAVKIIDVVMDGVCCLDLVAPWLLTLLLVCGRTGCR